MKRITKSISAIFIGAVFFVSCATASGAAEKAKQSAAAKNEADEILLAEQGMLAYNWMQQSGEYRALAYQAFNAAKAAFDAAAPANGMKKAVVVDLDETMIDNSAEGATRLLEHKGFDRILDDVVRSRTGARDSRSRGICKLCQFARRQNVLRFESKRRCGISADG